MIPDRALMEKMHGPGVAHQEKGSRPWVIFGYLGNARATWDMALFLDYLRQPWQPGSPGSTQDLAHILGQLR